MIRSRPVIAPETRQRGSVLLVALVMLMVMTLLMVSSMRTNTTDERMASNARDWNLAFEAAEAALRDAERDILKVDHVSGETGFMTGCSSDGLCKTPTDGTPVWVTLEENNDAGWLTGANSGKSVRYGTYTGADDIQGVAAQPRYIIEPIHDKSYTELPNRYFYRVTAVGFGANTSSRVMLQAVYRQLKD